MKKIIIFGGGSGLSQMLKGLKLFPIDITAVVSVSDNGGSTLRLRKDFNIPAVGDISKVLMAMSNTDKDIVNLMNYRFKQSKSLGNHSIKNLLLTALLEQKGSFASAIPVLAKLLDIEGQVLPITEDNAELVGITSDGKRIYGETSITKCKKKIKQITYDKEVTANPEVLKAIKDADLIIFSSGSLLTSIIPNIIIEDVVEAVQQAVNFANQESARVFSDTVAAIAAESGALANSNVQSVLDILDQAANMEQQRIAAGENISKRIPQAQTPNESTPTETDPSKIGELPSNLGQILVDQANGGINQGAVAAPVVNTGNGNPAVMFSGKNQNPGAISYIGEVQTQGYPQPTNFSNGGFNPYIGSNPLVDSMKEVAALTADD